MSGAPKSWTELRDLLGEEEARKLVELRGGEQVAVPRRADRQHSLLRALGEAAFRELVWRCGGCRFYVPELSAILRGERNERIRQLRAAGTTAREIARDEALSVRQVRNIVSGAGHG